MRRRPTELQRSPLLIVSQNKIGCRENYLIKTVYCGAFSNFLALVISHRKVRNINNET